ncbi:MAG: hypothetical protein HPY90_15270 [Syntrophothermus sp.]|uniref:hypothetical protein n=1 Tax=Syntrophothermus sp. TaxID=2736299 RepID=UPI00257A04A8|nr:hypothetical protein [Syntrophothermus sp.]NSW84559.1 hypothetical protein [Syntrophothermus sp.]
MERGTGEANIIWEGVAKGGRQQEGRRDQGRPRPPDDHRQQRDAPERRRDHDGRRSADHRLAMLPIRFLAQAPRADIQWNANAQEATINF